MNENHSRYESKYRLRWLASVLREAIKEHPVVVLTGARQTGKSSLITHEKPFPDWRYLNLDDFDILSQAKKNPASLWAGSNRIIIDEVQKSPELLTAVKSAVDADKKLRFVLSGSANLLLMKTVTESLAGRTVFFSLQPMTFGEMTGRPGPKLMKRLFTGKLPDEPAGRPNPTDPFSTMARGFMPALLTMRDAAVTRWHEGYVAAYLERDLRQFSQIDSLPDFRRLMVALALRCGRLLNQTEVSRDTGISQPTVHRYINLLETTCLVERLGAFTVNRTKRLVKSAKILWTDPGVASFLSGHFDAESLRLSREAGGIFEALVFLHLKVLGQIMNPKPGLYYWRTVSGKEVDFVLEWGRKLLAIEVKLSSKASYDDIGSLQMFMREYTETVAGVLVYTGNKIIRMDEKIIALPWNFLG